MSIIKSNGFNDDILRSDFWNPFEILGLRDDFRKSISDSFFSVEKQETEVKITCDLPGVRLEDVQLEIVGNSLKVVARRKGFSEKTYSGYVRLPTGYDYENSEAVLEYGVLSISAPKLEHEKPKKIEIKEKR